MHRNLKNPFLSSLAVLHALSALAADRKPPEMVACDVLLQRTLGFEWEYVGPRSELWLTASSITLKRLYKWANMNREEFGNSEFKRLYSPHTQDSSGTWKSHQLPLRLKSVKRFQAFIKKYRLQFHNNSTDSAELRNLEEINPQKFMMACLELISICDEEGISVKFLKNESEWKKNPQPLDYLMPKEVAVEWNGSDAMDFEFPIAGFVKTKREVIKYVEALMVRLGLFQQKEPVLQRWLETYASGHTHWVPTHDQIASLVDPSSRKLFYQAMINAWGASNDRIYVLRRFGVIPLQEGTFNIVHKDAETYSRELITVLYNEFHSKPLIQTRFETALAHPDGIILSSPKETFDMNDYKFHPIGLRFIYGGTEPQPNTPLTKPGLENRGARNLIDALVNLPEPLAAEGPLLLDFLESGRLKGRYGMLDEFSALKNRAKEVSLPESTFDAFHAAISEIHTYYLAKFKDLDVDLIPMAHVRAALFSALTDWRQNTIIEQKLKAMDDQTREVAVRRYQTAQANYQRRITNLVHAYEGELSSYHPEWEAIKMPKVNGQPIANVVDAKINGYASTANSNFISILAVENARFFVEAGLVEFFQ